MVRKKDGKEEKGKGKEGEGREEGGVYRGKKKRRCKYGRVGRNGHMKLRNGNNEPGQQMKRALHFCYTSFEKCLASQFLINHTCYIHTT